MSQLVHAHEVMNIILSHDNLLEVGELREKILSAYGENPLFFTCSAQDMALDDLLKFLQEKNKIEYIDGKIKVFRQNICNHS